MCHGDDARPPTPPVTGPLGAHGDLTLTSADGTAFMAYAALPGDASSDGIVILPDIRGLHQYYKDLADVFAQAGFNAVAFDYFGRTAETNVRDESFVFRPHVEATTPETVDADVAAAIAYLRSPEGGGATRIFAVGFCFGGSSSWRQSASQPGLAGAVGFYGQPGRARPYIDGMVAPLLLLVAGEDFTPLAEFEAFDAELIAAGVPHTMVVYPGAPHSFFDRSFAEHRDACADAWRQMLAFFGQPVE
ncbi:MAG: dienelactone hydrolase family protein [Thermomicrobiales bacterium]